MMESPTITLDPKIEQKMQQYIKQPAITFSGRIETIFSQDTRFEHMDLPIDIKIEMKGNEINLIHEDKAI